MKQKIMTLAATLLCMTLISIYMLCNMYARYTTNGTAEEHARVASFGQVTLEMPETQDAKLLPGDTSVTLDPKVSMPASEVAVAVYIYVTLPENSSWAYDATRRSFTCGPVLWTVAEGWDYLKQAEHAKTYIFRRFLEPKQSLAEERIVEGGTMKVPQNYDDYYGMTDTEVNMDIRFKARAVQAD